MLDFENEQNNNTKIIWIKIKIKQKSMVYLNFCFRNTFCVHVKSVWQLCLVALISGHVLAVIN